MASQKSLSDLEAYARKQITAEKYPNDTHITKLAKCINCGVVPMALTIVHHTGSKQQDFRGVIWGHCSQCGKQNRILSFTGEQRKFEREESPACGCGNTRFYICECERFEQDEGILGFFDEGVLVGQCAACGKNRTFVYTD